MTTPSKRDVASMLEATLDPDLEERRAWHPQELAAILNHQWNAPLEADLGGVSPERSRLLRCLCEADQLLIKSYGDVFSHPMPPIEILEMIKDYAKRNLARPDRELPEGIAEVLYTLSVVIARVRCNQRITSQDDEAVRRNIRSVLARSWVTQPVIDLLREGLQAFGG